MSFLYLVVVCSLVMVSNAIPVNVMLPLDVITSSGVSDATQLQKDLAQLVNGGGFINTRFEHIFQRCRWCYGRCVVGTCGDFL